jgi:hypothetical protein
MLQRHGSAPAKSDSFKSQSASYITGGSIARSPAIPIGSAMGSLISSGNSSRDITMEKLAGSYIDTSAPSSVLESAMLTMAINGGFRGSMGSEDEDDDAGSAEEDDRSEDG